MTPQEEQLLNSLVERVNQTQLQEKDPDAEALLNRQLGSNPDALYILAQTTLVQNIALEQAQAQLAQAKQQLAQVQQPAHATSFLGGLLGHRDPAPVAGPAAAPITTAAPAPGYQPVYAPSAPQYAQPQYQQAQFAPVASGQPSFLRGAMQTAAGVAAGALAFEGVEAVLHGIGGFGQPSYGWGGGPGFGFGPGFGGGGMMGGVFERPVEETVINNNYYDQPGGGERGVERHFSESADRDGAQLSDASYESSGDQGSYDDSGLDSSGNDDSGSFDDASLDSGGSFDDGGFGGDGGGDLS